MAKKYKAYKFRLFPTKEQRIAIAKTFGCTRLVYNFYLDKKISAYKADKTSLSYADCARDLTQLKKQEKYQFLSEVDSTSLQVALKHLDSAFQNFFHRKDMGFPKFKAKKSSRKSYTSNCVNGNIKLENGHIKLPKLGFVKVKQHRQLPEKCKIKSATVSQSPSGKYEVSILFEYENQVQKKKLSTFLGLDFSMRGLYVDSEGMSACYDGYYRKVEERLQREQRKLSKMQKDSKNRQKQRLKVAGVHEKAANQRRDFLHKQARKIADAYDCVCVEDLDMKAMAQSLHFGKSVHDNGWGMFTTFLKYKLEDRGGQLVKVDKFFASSQLCSCCGYKNPVVKDLSVRKWICPQCGITHNRDVNAAVNIKKEGMRLVTAS